MSTAHRLRTADIDWISYLLFVFVFLSAAPMLVGLGRGMPAQQPLNSSPAPAIAAVGRGQAAMRAPFQQPRKVTQTAAFTLPGIGRGISSVGRGGGGMSRWLCVCMNLSVCVLACVCLCVYAYVCMYACMCA